MIPAPAITVRFSPHIHHVPPLHPPTGPRSFARATTIAPALRIGTTAPGVRYSRSTEVKSPRRPSVIFRNASRKMTDGRLGDFTSVDLEYLTPGAVVPIRRAGAIVVARAKDLGPVGGWRGGTWWMWGEKRTVIAGGGNMVGPRAG